MKDKKSGLSRKKGHTLIELLFSLVICVLILGGVLQALVYLTAATSSNKNRSQVFQDIQATMERISGIQFSSLVTTFPDNQALSNAFVTNVLGSYKLPTESVVVSYPAGTGGNPLEVLVTGNWTEQGGARNVSVRTFRRG